MKTFQLAMTALLVTITTLVACNKSDRNIAAPEETVENNYNRNTFSSDNVITTDPALDRRVKQSVIRTFGKAIDAKVTSLSVQKIPNGNIYTYEYTTIEGKKSTFVVIDNSVLKSKVTVDCYGTCECREKVILDPQTGNPSSYECTCDKCKMSVTVES